jgi:hypothetical protein
MISGLCIARTGLKGKNGRVLNEVGLFLGQGRDDVTRGDTFSAWSKVYKSTASRSTTRTQ